MHTGGRPPPHFPCLIRVRDPQSTCSFLTNSANADGEQTGQAAGGAGARRQTRAALLGGGSEGKWWVSKRTQLPVGRLPQSRWQQ